MIGRPGRCEQFGDGRATWSRLREARIVPSEAPRNRTANLASTALAALLAIVSMAGWTPHGARAQQASAGNEAAGRSATEIATATGAEAKSAAVQELIRRLADKNFKASQSSVMRDVLRDPAATAAAVPALTEMLKAESQDAAAAAAAALAEIGAASAPAVPALKDIASTQPQGPLGAAATQALTRIAAAVERTRYQVSYEDELLSLKADQALLQDLTKEISSQAHIAIELGDGVGRQRISAEFAKKPLDEALRQLLADYDVFTYHRGGRGLLTVWVYGELEGRGLYPIPFKNWASTAEIEQRLHDYDPEQRARALETLVERGGTSAEQQVIKALDDADERVRMTALNQALREDMVLPPEKLSHLATDDSWHVIRFLALKNLTRGPVEAWPADAEWVAGAMLSDPNPVVGRYAETVLDRLNPPEKSVESVQRKPNSKQ